MGVERNVGSVEGESEKGEKEGRDGRRGRASLINTTLFLGNLTVLLSILTKL